MFRLKLIWRYWTIFILINLISMKFFLSIFIASLPSQGGVAEFQADDGHQRDGYYGCVGCGGSQNLTTDSPVLPFKHFIFVFECITGGWVTVAACSSGIQDSTLGLPSRQPCSSGTASSTKKGLDFRYFDPNSVICQIIAAKWFFSKLQAEVVRCAEKLATSNNVQ